MRIRPGEVVIASLPLLAAVASAFAYGFLPETIPTHWNAAGEADGFMSRELGLLVMPVVMAGTALVLLAVPRLDPLRANIELFRGRYELFCVVVMAFLLALHSMMLCWGLGHELSMNILMSVGFGAVLIAAGWMMRGSKRNYMAGIRTPWTLASDEVWERTHKLGGTLFMMSGGLAFVGVFLGQYAIIVIIVPVLASSVAAVAYSYFFHRKLGRDARKA